MHVAIRKCLKTGATSITTAGNWDGLKYQLLKLGDDIIDTRDWDSHNFSWENFKWGKIINDGVALWRHFDLTINDVYDVNVWEGEVLFLLEIDGV